MRLSQGRYGGFHSAVSYRVNPANIACSFEPGPELHFVSRLFVEIVPLGFDVGLVDLLCPVRGFDFLHRDGHELSP